MQRRKFLTSSSVAFTPFILSPRKSSAADDDLDVVIFVRDIEGYAADNRWQFVLNAAQMLQLAALVNRDMFARVYGQFAAVYTEFDFHAVFRDSLARLPWAAMIEVVEQSGTVEKNGKYTLSFTEFCAMFAKVAGVAFGATIFQELVQLSLRRRYNWGPQVAKWTAFIIAQISLVSWQIYAVPSIVRSARKLFADSNDELRRRKLLSYVNAEEHIWAAIENCDAGTSAFAPNHCHLYIKNHNLFFDENPAEDALYRYLTKDLSDAWTIESYTDYSEDGSIVWIASDTETLPKGQEVKSYSHWTLDKSNTNW